MKSAKEMFEELGYKHGLFGDKDNKNIKRELNRLKKQVRESRGVREI